MMIKLIFLILLIVPISFKSLAQQSFDIQGHRGCRGLMPENSIPGFIKAIDLGVTTLEMDVVISADAKVVVSHDLYISSAFCVNELGAAITKKEEKDIKIYNLNYEDVKLFDCGIKGNDKFPGQEKISIYKPLLSEVIDQCEKYIEQKNKKSVRYNIEIKSSSSGDYILHPDPALFTGLVHNVLKGRLPVEQITIQSFDMRVLQLMRMKYPEYEISLLISNNKSPAKNIEILGFKPEIYSPNFKLIGKKEIDELHSKSIKVIPWTVNETKRMKKLIDLGVDGFITDYPNRYFELN